MLAILKVDDETLLGENMTGMCLSFERGFRFTTFEFEIQNPHNPQITKFTLDLEKKKSRLNFGKEV